MLGKLFVNGLIVFLNILYAFQSEFTLLRKLDSNYSSSLSVINVLTHFSGSYLCVGAGVLLAIFGVNKSGTEYQGFLRSPI